MRFSSATALAACCLPLLAAMPAASATLYEGRTIVTGMDLRSRPGGLARVFAQILATVAGNPSLLDDPRLAAADPSRLLQSVAYLDRMGDEPKHDEQGTRDRPYDLVARFEPAGVDALLREWGEAPWPPPRPVVATAIRIVPRAGPPMTLHGDTDADERHRAALLAAAERWGIGVALPLTEGHAAAPAGPVLRGTIGWSEPDAGWAAQWTLAWQGREQHWGLRGVSFDAAYDGALAGVARALSGHL